jgi:predicted transcriptional regulator of viral defense system
MNKERTTLLKELKQSPFTVQAAKDVGLSFYDLQVLLGLKKIIKLERGVYAKQSTKSSDNQEMNIALVHLGEPSCICLLSALYLYGLTDEIPNQTWAYVPYEKFTRQANIKIIRKRNPNWEFGITTFDNMKVTSIERTLID